MDGITSVYVFSQAIISDITLNHTFEAAFFLQL